MKQPSAELRPHQTSLVLAGIATLVLWTVPWFAWITVPVQWLNTHLHEFCHAFAAILSGGPVQNIMVFANGNGTTLAGGSMLLVASAGYVGAAVIGALTILGSRSESGAANSLRTIGALLVFSLIFWVRGDAVGVASGIGWAALLFALPHMLKGRALVFAAQLIGMQQCLTSVQALYILLQISGIPGAHSDAANMQLSTGIPAIVWALGWSGIGAALLYFTLRAAWAPFREAPHR